MPAAAVIPAPIAYIKVVAVKKLVVGFRGPRPFPALGVVLVQFAGPGVSRRWRAACSAGAVRREASTARRLPVLSEAPSALDCSGRGVRDVYFEQIRVFQAGRSL